ncbi:LamG domain-containing protein [Bacillus cereus]|uniref:LamG domain-containing protein n=1 Tax=Bacillus cereus group TaxID=86661 RepID=UPI001F5A5E54|nr:LamG domain-containing protein [Bacillus thuringiensis]MCU5508192.1 LamG domain-containing protein [Bacillus cereus]MDA2417080.1 LamG domain-containing protein [Bacillus cereus]MDR4924606.1 LamG domain-containing protein [Bacillus thuringiensis]MED3584452.1 LamG domain-containing protein [Bacillus thuringiensis]HDR4861009.1 hypothetical protein [Bacillus cereus]
MDTISYGIANKAKDAESSLRNQTLSDGVEGKFMNVKERIDSLEKYLEGLSLRANKLIVHDAVNIMKAHAKLNSIAKTTKYNMQNMMFDDLLDASGIDADKSSGYSHDTQFGFIQSNSEAPCIIETVAETVQSSPEKVILLAGEQKKEFNKYGMKFNGSNSHIVIPGWTSGPSTGTFTCEITVTLNSTKNQCFVAFNEDNILCGYYENKLQLRVLSYVIWGPALEAGRDYKLRFVIERTDKSYFRIYVDGNLVANGETANLIPLSANSWSIGQETDGGSYSDFVDGTLANIRLWEKVADTVGTELSGNEEGLLLYYDFAEGEGTAVIDKSSNRRNGQAQNAIYVKIRGKNIARDADIQATGEGFFRGDKSGMTDGNKTNYVWDDSSNGTDDGFLCTFPEKRNIGSVIIYADPTWPVCSGKLLVDGIVVAVNPNKFITWEVPVDKAAQKIEFIRTTTGVDQGIAEVEIFEANSNNELVQDGSYLISRDNGETWTPITPEKLFYFDNKTIPAGTQLKVKAIIPSGIKLLNYALTWA